MSNSTSDYIPTIGLEVHVQLKTASKMFCSCRTEYGAPPNSLICPVCLGLPGALPTINHEALYQTALAGLMLGCTIPPICKFDRKNYFYPDMPKNYQISQYDQPLCLGGTVPLYPRAYPKEVQKSDIAQQKKIRLTRIHLEEDVAKSLHLEHGSGIDFNRAGTPLMEIVSEPDIGSAEEAFAYLSSLRQILIAGNVADADMEKGQMRCDVNISLRPANQETFGTKIELKNLNSISGVRRALIFEIERQRQILSSGGSLQQETRRWDDERGETILMRIKESAHDYRYFPDPDLLPVHTEELVKVARQRLPELPQEKCQRLIQQYQISDYDAAVLTEELPLAAYFEEALTYTTSSHNKGASTIKPKIVANWIINDLLSALATSDLSLEETPIPPKRLIDLLSLIESGKISGRQGKEVFAFMMQSPESPQIIIQQKGMEQVSDTNLLENFCDQVIQAHPTVVTDYQGGKTAALNFLKGQVMKLSKGKANPSLVGEMLATKLS